MESLGEALGAGACLNSISNRGESLLLGSPLGAVLELLWATRGANLQQAGAAELPVVCLRPAHDRAVAIANLALTLALAPRRVVLGLAVTLVTPRETMGLESLAERFRDLGVKVLVIALSLGLLGSTLIARNTVSGDICIPHIQDRADKVIKLGDALFPRYRLGRPLINEA